LNLLFVADGRSPIAINWIQYFIQQGHNVHLVSMFPCRPELRLASLTILPVAFSRVVDPGEIGKSGEGGGVARRALKYLATPSVRTYMRHIFIPRSLPKVAVELLRLIESLKPDLVHAMRIPYEGMLAALAMGDLEDLPLVVSVWGNDFTLHAPATSRMADYTHLTLSRADGLHTDCHRDGRLAGTWGFDSQKPRVVLPGGGGIRPEIFYPGDIKRDSGEMLPPDTRVVINPRGLRAYVRNDTFFASIPLVLEEFPEARFVCPVMEGAAQATQWVQKFDIAQSVRLLPRLSHDQLADWFRRSEVVVSPSTHDGTPNSLLEAMACGCFPVVGDLESLREWIIPGVNGFLVDVDDPVELAKAIVLALQETELRARAKQHNAHLIAERATYEVVMGEASEFYQNFIESA
jgi:glycosyltransferase involved in cell wall biosynthesis